MSDLPHITQNFARPSYRPAEVAGMDPEMRRMAMMAAGFGGLLAVVIGVFSFSGHRHHGVPVIAPPATPVRIKPVNAGGMTVAGAEDFSSTQGEQLAPPAEKPAIRALRSKKIAKPTVVQADIEAKSAPRETLPASAPAAKTMPPVVAPAVPASAPPGTWIQLAAFESQQAAEQDWGKMAEKMPKMFDGHRPEVVQGHIAGRIVYRLRTGGFASAAAASTFCGEVRAKGGDCSIAAF
jgi:hypothetical protein